MEGEGPLEEDLPGRSSLERDSLERGSLKKELLERSSAQVTGGLMRISGLEDQRPGEG